MSHKEISQMIKKSRDNPADIKCVWRQSRPVLIDERNIDNAYIHKLRKDIGNKIKEELASSELTNNSNIEQLAEEYKKLIITQYDESEIQQLEQDVIELNQIFKDINMMIMEQSPLLDNIEMNIMSADSAVQSGVEQIKKAETLQKKASNKLKYLVGTLAAVGGIIGIGLGLRFR